MDKPSGVGVYAFGGYRLDTRRRVLSGPDGDPIALKPKVFDTLVCLVERAGESLDRSALLEAIWPNVVVEEHNLNKNVSVLRQVFGEGPRDNRFIVTIPGRGYQFVAAVRKLELAELGARPAPTSIVFGQGSASRVRSMLGSRTLALTVLGIVAAAVPIGLAVIAGHVMNAAQAGAGASIAGCAASPGAFPLTAGRTAIAVLPLKNIGNAADALYAGGMHAEIANRLTEIRGFDVINVDAVSRYAADERPLGEIADALGVQALLSGTFQSLDGHVRVQVQLVEPHTGRNLWVCDSLSDSTDVFAMQGDIALQVANALAIEVSMAAESRVVRWLSHSD